MTVLRFTAAATAGVLVAVILWWALPARTGGTPPPVTRPVTVTATFSDAAAEFADTLTAQVVVVLDRSAVRPETLHVVDGVAPLTVLSSSPRDTYTHGRTTVVSLALQVACVTDACVTRSGTAALTPHAVRVDVQRRDGTTVRTSAHWPPLTIRGRVSAADIASAKPPFRGSTALPAARYRFRPQTLALLLDLAAVVLIAGGLALAATSLARKRVGKGALDEGDPLHRALAAARASHSRPAPDRRSALGAVARLLSTRSEPLAENADELAWSRPVPSPDAVTELVDEVEREVAT